MLPRSASAEDAVYLEAARMKTAAAQKAVSGTPTSVYAHGPGGLLSVPGLAPGIVSAMVMPRGLQARLPLRRSAYEREILGVLTGQTATTGSEPTTACADGPQAGNLKLCMRTLPFGRLVRESQVVQVDRAGQLLNRSEFTDYRLLNNPFENVEAPVPVTPAEALRNEAQAKLFTLAVALERDFARLPYTGNVANTASNTGYMEYYGLDYQINTGYQDALSGLPCKAVDSVVRSFGNAVVNDNGALAVTEIVEMFNYLRHLAEQVGFGDMTWALVMRYQLFRQLSAIWPCAYLTSGCAQASASTPAITLTSEQITMRDDMRNNSYLLIDGMKIEVIIDDAITETLPGGITGPGQSDIYFVPLQSSRLTETGGYASFFEYFDMGNEQIRAVIDGMTPTGSFMPLANGRYLLHKKPPTNECVQIRMLTRPRLVVYTPFLAGRLTNMRYRFSIHERTYDPNDPYFFYNGGSTVQDAGVPRIYAPRA